MATTYRTIEGDVLDTLCLAHYGKLPGTVEAVLEANENLAREPQPFRSGVLIRMPDIAVAATSSVALWD